MRYLVFLMLLSGCATLPPDFCPVRCERLSETVCNLEEGALEKTCTTYNRCDCSQRDFYREIRESKRDRR